LAESNKKMKSLKRKTDHKIRKDFSRDLNK